MPKKHIPAEEHIGWTVKYPLFESPSAQEEADLAKGWEVFSHTHPDSKLFPDPFLERIVGAEYYPLEKLVIVPPDRGPYFQWAEAFQTEVRRKWDVSVSILTPSELAGGLNHSAPLLLLGGSDTHPLSMDLARRYQIGLFSNQHPGLGGWGYTTHWALEHGMPPRYLAAFKESQGPTVQRRFLECALSRDTPPGLRWAHEVCCPALRNALGENFSRWVSGRYSWFPHFRGWLESGMARPYRQVFLEWFAQDFPRSLPYSAPLIDLGVDAARYYQLTGDEEALSVFREMLWGIWDLLNQPGANIYISDIDFRLGTICNCWNWVQHHPAVTAREREVFAQLLLGLTRMVHDYFTAHWKSKPGPHNHRTFKARSLIQSWRFFQAFDGIPDRESWRSAAAGVFETIPSSAFKYRENATHYEMFAPEHLLVWHETMGKPVSQEQRASVFQFALRAWAMRDSFLTPVEFGDSDPTFRPSKPFPALALLPFDEGTCRASAEEHQLRELESALTPNFPFEFPSATQSFTGIDSHPGLFSSANPVPGWDRLQLDPSFAFAFQAGGTESTRFDKLVWRSGWDVGSAYLALEGIGRGKVDPGVSHAHHEANSVLRLNLGGRIWLINNGYGKKESTASAREAFAGRQIGPEDHNTLVLRNLDSGETLKPPVNATLRELGDFPVPFAITEIADYEGYSWTRHILFLDEVGVLFFDKVLAPADLARRCAPELQWNLLGQKLLPQTREESARFSQNQSTLIFDHFGSAIATWKESEIASWRRLVQSGEYPHTTEPPNLGVLKKADPTHSVTEADWFVSGFWLDGAISRQSWNAESLRLQLDFHGRPFCESNTDHPLGRVRTTNHRLEIEFRG